MRNSDFLDFPPFLSHRFPATGAVVNGFYVRPRTCKLEFAEFKGTNVRGHTDVQQRHWKPTQLTHKKCILCKMNVVLRFARKSVGSWTRSHHPINTRRVAASISIEWTCFQSFSIFCAEFDCLAVAPRQPMQTEWKIKLKRALALLSRSKSWVIHKSLHRFFVPFLANPHRNRIQEKSFHRK